MIGFALSFTVAALTGFIYILTRPRCTASPLAAFALCAGTGVVWSVLYARLTLDAQRTGLANPYSTHPALAWIATIAALGFLVALLWFSPSRTGRSWPLAVSLAAPVGTVSVGLLILATFLAPFEDSTAATPPVTDTASACQVDLLTDEAVQFVSSGCDGVSGPLYLPVSPVVGAWQVYPGSQEFAAEGSFSVTVGQSVQCTGRYFSGDGDAVHLLQGWYRPEGAESFDPVPAVAPECYPALADLADGERLVVHRVL